MPFEQVVDVRVLIRRHHVIDKVISTAIIMMLGGVLCHVCVLICRSGSIVVVPA